VRGAGSGHHGRARCAIRGPVASCRSPVRAHSAWPAQEPTIILRRLTLLLLLIVPCGQGEANSRQEPWAVAFPEVVLEGCTHVESSPSDSMHLSRRTPHLFRRSNPRGKTLQAIGKAGRWRTPRVIGTSSSLGLFAVELDSCWSEQEVVSADMKPYWPNAPDSTSRQLCFPFVDLMDTTGVRLLHIPGARDPSWSRDGAQLAYRVVRKPIQRIGGKIFSYPESSDSIVVLTIRTDSRAAYPIASSLF